MLTLEEIRQMSPEELASEIAKTQHELLKTRLQTQSGQSKETSRLKTLRRTIARLNTVKKEKELSTSVNK